MFFFQFFPSPEGNIAHILGGVSFVKMLRFFPGFDAYFEFFAFLPRPLGFEFFSPAEEGT